MKRSHLAPLHGVTRAVVVVEWRITSAGHTLGGDRLDEAFVDVAVVVEERPTRRRRGNHGGGKSNGEGDGNEGCRKTRQMSRGHGAKIAHTSFCTDPYRGVTLVPIGTHMLRRLLPVFVAVAVATPGAAAAGADREAPPSRHDDIVLVKDTRNPAPNGRGRSPWRAMSRDELEAIGGPGNGIEVAENSRYELHGHTEPMFDDQWALGNIEAARAWELTDGSENVVVAVLDGGVDIDHPELAGQLLVNHAEVPGNGIDDDGNGYVDDYLGYDFFGHPDEWQPDPDVSDSDGHGTFVSGIISAAFDDRGMAGLAPGAQLLAVRVCGGGGCTAAAIVAGVDYALARGADVINMSFGGPYRNPAIEDAIDRAGAAGVLVVASAGNEGHDNDDAATPTIFPASYPAPNLLSVTSTTESDGFPTGLANYGAATVDLGAPGEGIRSLHLDAGYANGSGTSFAAPHVAATAALMLSVRPELTPRDVADLLRDSADPVAALDGITVSGGRLNAYRAAGLATLSDIGSSVFFDEALWLHREGITRGCNPPANSRFCPERSVTRGQMAAFLVRALELPPASRDWFADDDAAVFEDDINRLAEAGITRGCNPPAGDRFCPGRTVTRGQMAAFLSRAFGYVNEGGGDLFVDDDHSVFETDIDRLATAGVTMGCNPPTNDRFCPGRTVTRGQMAAFLERALTG